MKKEEDATKIGRPREVSTQVLIEAALRLGYPASTTEIAEAAGCERGLVKSRLLAEPERWASVGNGSQKRHYPAGMTPRLLTAEEVQILGGSGEGS